MADTGGIAALMKALNDTPNLGSGLKANGVSKTNGIAKPRAATTVTTSAVTSSKADLVRSFRAAAAAAAPVQLPKILGAEGKGFDPKAPRGSYLDLVV